MGVGVLRHPELMVDAILIIPGEKTRACSLWNLPVCRPLEEVAGGDLGHGGGTEADVPMWRSQPLAGETPRGKRD
jgi:hypothetical protein